MLTHVRMIFDNAKALTMHTQINLDEASNEVRCRVVWKDIWTTIPGGHFATWCEIYVGVKQPDETDMLGNLRPGRALGVYRGEFRAMHVHHFGSPYKWIEFALQYDMDEGPETWRDDEQVVVVEKTDVPNWKLTVKTAE